MPLYPEKPPSVNLVMGKVGLTAGPDETKKNVLFLSVIHLDYPDLRI